MAPSVPAVAVLMEYLHKNISGNLKVPDKIDER